MDAALATLCFKVTHGNTVYSYDRIKSSKTRRRSSASSNLVGLLIAMDQTGPGVHPASYPMGAEGCLSVP
jgi:hypothetical protein